MVLSEILRRWWRNAQVSETAIRQGHRQRSSKMSMNFVTFNQDYSHLAVGEYLLSYEAILLSDNPIRHVKGIPYIHNWPILQMLRNQARWHCAIGDAILNIVGSPYTFTATVANHKYQSTSLSPRIVCVTGKWYEVDEHRLDIIILQSVIGAVLANNFCSPETINNMRAHLSYNCTSGST